MVGSTFFSGTSGVFSFLFKCSTHVSNTVVGTVLSIVDVYYKRRHAGNWNSRRTHLARSAD